MQKVNKEFRLFISSTFNDFTAEREVLHKDIFPSIKKKCEKEGYSFIPVDLRWGVTEEAGLDQRTLQICLDEVKSCKSAPKPNFLIMVGDRYGWVPLPYSICKEELECMLQYASDKDEKAIREWYKLDGNNVPPSYRLEKRTGDYINSDKWTQKENELREILQDLANKSFEDKESDKYKKYFTSATEAEIINGINDKGGQIDKEAVFGYLRNVTNDADTCDLKNRLTAKLCPNIFKEDPKDLTQVSDDFKKNIKQFLESRIDQQIAEDKEKEDSTSDQDLHDQFADSKIQTFIGQESVLHDIEGYLTSDLECYLASDLTSPFLLTGLSGSGKSAVMAMAYLNAPASGDDVIVASRFIGGASGAFSIEQFCASFIKQLGDNDAKQAIKEIQKNKYLSSQEKSERIQAKFCDFLKQDRSLWLFIDSLDQLPGKPSLDWLPETLGQGVKVVVSALNDESYGLASEYFELLEKRLPEQVIKTINPFSKEDCKELLNALLTNEERTLQANQFEYVLEKCNKVKTPLYVVVAVQEVKFWRSFDELGIGGVSLQASRRGIVLEYIQNLYLYHHNHPEMVLRALSFIGAFDQGVAESEIISLLNLDNDFIGKVAPDTYFKKDNNEIPISIWARLRNGIMPFIRSDQSDGKTRYSFIHREFYAAVQSLPTFVTSIDSSIVRLHAKVGEHHGYLSLRNQLIKCRLNTLSNVDLASELEKYEEASLSYEDWGKIIDSVSSNYDLVSFDEWDFSEQIVQQGVSWLLEHAAKEKYFDNTDKFVSKKTLKLSGSIYSADGVDNNIFIENRNLFDFNDEPFSEEMYATLKTWHPSLILAHWENYDDTYNQISPLYAFVKFLKDYLSCVYNFDSPKDKDYSSGDAESVGLYLQYLAGIAIIQLAEEDEVGEERLGEVNDLISKTGGKEFSDFITDVRYPGFSIFVRFCYKYRTCEFSESRLYEKLLNVLSSISIDELSPLNDFASLYHALVLRGMSENDASHALIEHYQSMMSSEKIFAFIGYLHYLKRYERVNPGVVENLLEVYRKAPGRFYEPLKQWLLSVGRRSGAHGALLGLERYAYLKGMDNEWIKLVEQRSSDRYDFWRQVAELLKSETFYGARWVSSLDEEFLWDIHHLTRSYDDKELSRLLVEILAIFLEEPFDRLPIYRLALGYYDVLLDVPDAKLAAYKASGIKDFQQKNFKENVDFIRYSLGDPDFYSDMDWRVWAFGTQVIDSYWKEDLFIILIVGVDELYKSFKASMDDQLLPDGRFEDNLGGMPSIVGVNVEPEFDAVIDPQPILAFLLYLYYLESDWFKDDDEKRVYFDELVERLKESRHLDFEERYKPYLEALLLTNFH